MRAAYFKKIRERIPDVTDEEIDTCGVDLTTVYQHGKRFSLDMHDPHRAENRIKAIRIKHLLKPEH